MKLMVWTSPQERQTIVCAADVGRRLRTAIQRKIVLTVTAVVTERISFDQISAWIQSSDVKSVVIDLVNHATSVQSPCKTWSCVMANGTLSPFQK